MPNDATLAQLRTRTRQAADMVTGQLAAFVTDAEVNGYINDSLSELHDLLVLRYEDYARSIAQFQLVAQQELYPLPDDYYKHTGVFYLDSAGVNPTRYRLKQYMTREATRYQSTWVAPSGNSRGLAFHVYGNNIQFIPRPVTAGTIELWYIPQYTKLYNDADTVSVSVVNGWEEYVVVDAAIKCRDRGDLDTARLTQRKGSLEKRIEMAAAGRNASEPMRVVDVYARDNWRGGY